MARYEEYYRARNITVSIRLSPEEYRNMEERIKITGLAKNEFIIRSVLGEPIIIRAGKFESDRLSLEVKRLKSALQNVTVPEEAVGLLLECRALLEQFIEITLAFSRMTDNHCSSQNNSRNLFTHLTYKFPGPSSGHMPVHIVKNLI
jgi:hypothetical protein